MGEKSSLTVTLILYPNTWILNKLWDKEEIKMEITKPWHKFHFKTHDIANVVLTGKFVTLHIIFST